MLFVSVGSKLAIVGELIACVHRLLLLGPASTLEQNLVLSLENSELIPRSYGSTHICIKSILIRSILNLILNKQKFNEFTRRND